MTRKTCTAPGSRAGSRISMCPPAQASGMTLILPSCAATIVQEISQGILEDTLMASPLFDLTGKVAVVTGSSKGIGKAIAMHLALAGAKVVVSSRKAPVCEEAAAEIKKAGGEAIVIPCNISDKAQCETLITQTQK